MAAVKFLFFLYRNIHNQVLVKEGSKEIIHPYSQITKATRKIQSLDIKTFLYQIDVEIWIYFWVKNDKEIILGVDIQTRQFIFVNFRRLVGIVTIK